MNLWQKTKKLFWISRPISWLNTAFPYAAGYLMTGGGLDAVFWIGTLYFLAPYNVLMYGVNDVFDYESDIKNPRKGGIEGMREQRSFHPTIIVASVAVNLPFVLYLFVQGNMASRLTLIILVFFVLAYSLKYLRFKERPFLDSVTSSIHFVGPLIYALSLVSFTPTAWPYVIAFFLWGMASHAFGAVQDITPDRHAKLASIATFLGASWTVWFALVLYLAASVIVISQSFPFYFIGIAGLAYIINILPYAFLSDRDSMKANVGWKHFLVLNYLCGFVLTLVLIYISL